MESAQHLQARLVINESPKTLLLGVPSAWLLAAAMWEGQRTGAYAARVFCWAALLTLLLLRGVRIARASHPTGSYERLLADMARLRRNGSAVAVAWGLTAVVMLPSGDFEHKILLVVAISLIIVGGAMGRAVHVPQIARFVMISCTVFSAGLIAQRTSFDVFIGLGYLLFGPVIALFVRAQDNAVRRERELNLANEQLLRQAESARSLAERASAAKTRFLAAASHDLRQPMHSIGLVVGLLHERMQDPELSALTGKAQASIATMERLFGSLLDISKLDAGAVRTDVGPVDVARLFARTEETWGPQAVERGLRLRIRPASAVVRSDAELLERILGNLVSNAVRYTPRGGVLVACRRRGHDSVLEVWDSGRGIAPEHQAAIFEEFFRVDAPNPGRDKGLGLGLSIVQRSAQLLGHPLAVASRPGRGSVFRLTLPRLDEGVATATLEAVADATGEGLPGAFVVVVDDDENAREATVEVLRRWRCHVIGGASGDEVCTALAGHLRTPDLVITDYRLDSAEDGLQVVARIRALADVPIPALLVTADTDAGLPARAEAAGIVLLHKPVSFARLVQAAVAGIAARPADAGTDVPLEPGAPELSADGLAAPA